MHCTKKLQEIQESHDNVKFVVVYCCSLSLAPLASVNNDVGFFSLFPILMTGTQLAKTTVSHYNEFPHLLYVDSVTPFRA